MSKDVENLDPARELARLNEELRRKEKEIRGYKGQIGRLQSLTSVPKPESGVEKPEGSQTKPPEAEKPHYVGSWQQFCPDCGQKNPEFKDETECVDCKMHLGSKQAVEKLKACPNCGGKKARLIGSVK